MRKWVELITVGGATGLVAFCVSVPASSGWHVTQWSAGWFQVVVTLMAVMVALGLPFYQERKKNEEYEKKKTEEETAFLICMHHQFLLLKHYFDTAGQAFGNRDGIRLKELAYKAKPIFPDVLLNQTNELLPLYSKLDPLYQTYMAISIASAREIMADVEQLTKSLVKQGKEDEDDYFLVIMSCPEDLRDKLIRNSEAGYDHSDLLINLSAKRFKVDKESI